MTFDKTIAYLQAQMQTNKKYRSFIHTEIQRALCCAESPILDQKGYSSPWCYFCDELLGRMAFLIALTRNKTLMRWTHDAVLWIADQDDVEWIGPNNPRTEPLIGSLATAHTARGISTVLLFCPEIFSNEELQRVKQALTTKALVSIDRYLEPRMSDPSKSRNNWCIILLSGAMFSCMALGKSEKLCSYLPFYNLLHTDYNSDFYGETVGYWNYSFTGFFTTHLMLEQFAPEILSQTESIQTAMRPFVWAYYHRQGLFELQGFDRQAYRALTFGDCNTIWEVKPDALLYIATHHEDERVRALATECFLEPHIDQGDDVPPLSTLMLLPYLKESSKDTSFLPTSRLFGDGYLMYKDAWENPSIQIALQTGLDELPRVGAHHHADQLSFQLAKNGVVLLDDPSRCCYRLALQALSASAKWHSVPHFTTEDGTELLQTATLPKLYRAGKYNRLENAKVTDHAFFAISEASSLYPDEITLLRRTFVGVGEHILIIKDDYEATKPVFKTASFVGNNRRDQMTAQLLADGGILAREGVGVKLQALQPTTSSLENAALHDRYIASEDSPYHGCEGSGYILRIQNKSAATKASDFYVVFADHENDLHHWNAALKDSLLEIHQHGKAYCTVDFSNGVQIEKNGQNLLS